MTDSKAVAEGFVRVSHPSAVPEVALLRATALPTTLKGSSSKVLVILGHEAVMVI